MSISNNIFGKNLIKDPCAGTHLPKYPPFTQNQFKDEFETRFLLPSNMYDQLLGMGIHIQKYIFSKWYTYQPALIIKCMDVWILFGAWPVFY